MVHPELVLLVTQEVVLIDVTMDPGSPNPILVHSRHQVVIEHFFRIAILKTVFSMAGMFLKNIVQLLMLRIIVLAGVVLIDVGGVGIVYHIMGINLGIG